MDSSSGVALGPYQLIERLGHGTTATLYRARHIALDGFVGVKVLHEQFARDPRCRRRFLAAARACALLNHPHVANVVDYGQQEGVVYLVMELAGRGPLAALRRPMAPGSLLKLLEPVARALDYAHACGTLHLGIKPANILIRADGSAALADFLLSRLANSNGTSTDAVDAPGPSEYRAPEQAVEGPVGGAADRYALAVVCREMLSGLLPFQSGAGRTVMSAPLDSTIRIGSAIATRLPDAVTSVLDRGMATAPADRHSSAEALMVALSSAYANDLTGRD